MADEYLYIKEECVGKLEWSAVGDFPWAKGRFIPKDAFNQFSAYVKNIERPDGIVMYRLDLFSLEDAGYKSSDIRLVDCDSKEVTYLVALDYRDDGTAHWRISMTPDDD